MHKTWVLREGYISARLLTKPGPARCFLAAVMSGRSESPEGQPAVQVSSPAPVQAVMLQDRFVNILNRNKAHIIGVGLWYLGIWWSKPVVCRKRSYHLWYLATKPLFASSNHKKGASNLTSSWSWISYKFTTRSKSKSTRPSKGGRRELSSSPLHFWDTEQQRAIWQMSHELFVSKLGPQWTPPECQPDPPSKGLVVPLETCSVADEFSLILAGSSSPALLFPSS